MRYYRRQGRRPRAPQGGRVIAVPKQPHVHRWDDETGEFVQLPQGPHLGVPEPEHQDAVDDFGADGDYYDLPSDGSDPANEYILRLDMGNGTHDEWLRQQFRRTCAVQVLQMAEVDDSTELVLMAPVYDASSRRLGVEARADAQQQAARANPFAVLHVRQVLCSDGIPFCNTCSNPGCDRSAADNLHIKNAMQHKNQHHATMADVFGTAMPLRQGGDCRAVAGR
jgi:hypothetical protein